VGGLAKNDTIDAEMTLVRRDLRQARARPYDATREQLLRCYARQALKDMQSS